jgi:hypothetical protein
MEVTPIFGAITHPTGIFARISTFPYLGQGQSPRENTDEKRGTYPMLKLFCVVIRALITGLITVPAEALLTAPHAVYARQGQHTYV